MDEVRKLFNQVELIIKRSENNVPLEHQNVGGMWTADTYQKSGVTYLLVDEGYKSIIRTANVEVVDGWKNGKQDIWFNRGGLQELQEVFNRLSGKVTN